MILKKFFFDNHLKLSETFRSFPKSFEFLNSEHFPVFIVPSKVLKSFAKISVIPVDIKCLNVLLFQAYCPEIFIMSRDPIGESGK